MSVAYAIHQVFNFIYFLLLVFIVLTWIPNVKWDKEPFFTIRKFADFFFMPFRKIIPPVGMFDLSPIVCFILLQVLEKVLMSFFMG